MHSLTVVQVYCRHNSSFLTVQLEEDGEWSVGRVLKNEMLISNNTVYQDILREGRRKSLPVAGRRIIAELEQEIQHLHQEKVILVSIREIQGPWYLFIMSMEHGTGPAAAGG